MAAEHPKHDQNRDLEVVEVEEELEVHFLEEAEEVEDRQMMA